MAVEQCEKAAAASASKRNEHPWRVPGFESSGWGRCEAVFWHHRFGDDRSKRDQVTRSPDPVSDPNSTPAHYDYLLGKFTEIPRF